MDNITHRTSRSKWAGDNPDPLHLEIFNGISESVEELYEKAIPDDKSPQHVMAAVRAMFRRRGMLVQMAYSSGVIYGRIRKDENYE